MSKNRQQREVGNEAGVGSNVGAPLDDVAAQRRVLAELQERREAQLHRKSELESERKTHAYAAVQQSQIEEPRIVAPYVTVGGREVTAEDYFEPNPWRPPGGWSVFDPTPPPGSGWLDW